MEKNILVVFDMEVEYASSLMDYLNKSKNVPFEVHAFTKEELFLEFLQNKVIDILLISENAMENVSSRLDSFSIGEVFVLSEDGELARFQGHRSIYKYQSTDNILREIMCYYADAGTLIKSRIYMDTKLEIIGIYSPVKRTLKTSFSITLGQILAEKKRVLYINLEEYAGFNTLMKTTYMTDMSDLMFYISQGKPNFIWKLASMVQSIGNLDYIPPALSPLDIKNITGRQWIDFFNELHKCNYDTVILDLGDSVNGLFEILRLCTRIYTPVRDDGISYAKLEQYEALLKIMEYDDVIEKTRKLSFSYFHGLEKGLDRLAYSELGTYTRKLLMQDSLI